MLSTENTLTEYIAFCDLQGLKAKTIRNYRFWLQKWVLFCPESTPCTRLSEFLRQWPNQRTRKTVYATIRAFERWVSRRDGSRPCWIDEIHPRFDPPPEYDPVSLAEFERIIAAFNLDEWTHRRDRAYITVLFYTGARRDAIRKLRWKDVDAENRRIRIRTKGGVESDICLPTPAVHVLEQWEPDSAGEYVFPALHKPGPICESHCSHLVPIAAHRAGIKRRIWTHLLRHSAATILLERGVSLPIIQRQLLHRSPVTTARYLHLTTRAVQRQIDQAWKGNEQ